MSEESIPVAGTPPSDEKANDRSKPDPDGDGFIRMLMHDFVGGSRGLDCFFADAARDSFGVFDGHSKTLPGFGDFFSGHVGRGGYQGARVIDERGHVIAVWVGGCVHILFCPYFFSLVAVDAFGEPATFKTEFVPPKGLGTVSFACGSGIQRPSTTKQYS